MFCAERTARSATAAARTYAADAAASAIATGDTGRMLRRSGDAATSSLASSTVGNRSKRAVSGGNSAADCSRRIASAVASVRPHASACGGAARTVSMSLVEKIKVR